MLFYNRILKIITLYYFFFWSHWIHSALKGRGLLEDYWMVGVIGPLNRGEGPEGVVTYIESQITQTTDPDLKSGLCCQSGILAEPRLCQGLWKRLCCCNHAQTWRWHVHLPTFIPSMIITENRFMPSSRLCSFEFHSSFGTWETKAYRGQILNRVYGKQTPDRRMFLDLPNHGSNFSHWLGFENQRIICFKKLLQLSPWGRVCLWALRSWALTNTHTN